MDMQIINPEQSDNQPENIEEKVKGEIIVTFMPEQVARQGIEELSSKISAIADKYGIMPHRTLRSINACAYKVPVGKEEELIEKLKQDGGILNVERSRYFRMMGKE